MDMKSIGLRHSSLTDTIYLCRFGKDPGLALDKREAEQDVMTVLVEHLFHDMSSEDVSAVIKEFRLGDTSYKLTLERA